MTAHGALISAAALRTEQRVCIDARAMLGDAFWGPAQYAAGHIPGAAFLHLDYELSDLSKKATLGRHPLPNPMHFAVCLARLGLTPETPIAAYDQDSGAYAARLWWLLRAAGFSNVAVLDGGLAAWIADGGPIDQSQPQCKPCAPQTISFDAMPQRDVIALQVELAKSESLLLDARARMRFAGLEEPIDPVAGHIPGALNRPFSDNMSEGRFKSPAQLRAEFAELLGSRSAKQTVHSCGSGVTACHNLLAMEHAGLVGSALFAPGWSGWICDPARPIVREQAPT